MKNEKYTNTHILIIPMHCMPQSVSWHHSIMLCQKRYILHVTKIKVPS